MLQRAEKPSLMATDADIDAKLNELKAPAIRRKSFSASSTAQDHDGRFAGADPPRTQHQQADQQRDHVSHRHQRQGNCRFLQRQPGGVQHTGAADPPGSDHGDSNGGSGPQSEERQRDHGRSGREKKFRRSKLAEVRARTSRWSRRTSRKTPNSASNGGDMGFIPESNFEKADPRLHSYMSQLAPGQISSIIPASGALRIFKVIAREPAGSARAE